MSNTIEVKATYIADAPKPNLPQVGESVIAASLTQGLAEPENMEISENVVRKLDGVEFVIPNEFNNFSEYVQSLSTKSSARMGILSKPTYIPEYREGVYHNPWLSETPEEFGGEDFYSRAFEFFRDPNADLSTYFDEREKFLTEVMYANQELKQQIADGKGDNLETLTSTITLRGQQMTLADLNKIHDTFAFGAKGIDTAITRGLAVNFQHTAIQAMSIAAVRKQLSDVGLSNEIANMATKTFQERIEQSIQKRAEIKGKSDHDPLKNEKYYYIVTNHNLEDSNSFNTDIYKKITNIDGNSGTFEKDFQKFYSWYFENMEEWNNACNNPWGDPTSQSSFLYDLKSIFFK